MRILRILIAALMILSATSLRADDKSYSIAKSIPVGGEGGWDYVTVDPQTHLVYVTRATHTQVIDPEAGKLIADITGQKRSHGVAIVSDVNRGFISDGGDRNAPGGAIFIFDLK